MIGIVEQLRGDISMHMDGIVAICKAYGYEIIPSLVLRHPSGNKLSMLLSNDDPSKVVDCIDFLTLDESGVESPTSMLDPEVER